MDGSSFAFMFSDFLANRMSEYEHNNKGQCDEFDESGPSTMTTTNLGVLNSGFVAEKKKRNLKEKPYVRLNRKTDISRISECLFGIWEMVEPDVIFSVLSDSEYSTAKGNEVIDGMSNGSVQNICRSLVTAAASTNAWIITGGLKKGIDHLIGSEVKQKLANRDKIPLAVLGISNWECLAETKDLLKDSGGSISNPSELSLSPNHTHFLLVNDGTQMKPCSECSLREKVELALMKREANEAAKNQNRPLIYILIGGSVNAFGVVERALANGIPVISVTGTGGSADIICGKVTSKDGVTLDYLPEVFEEPFRRLEEFLSSKYTSPDDVRQVIAITKAETKIEPFFEIVELLDKATLSDEATQQFRNDITTLKNRQTNELLTGIKGLLLSSQNCSTANVEFEIVNRLRAVFEQMLVVRGVTLEIAKLAVDGIEPDLLNDTLTKIKFVCGCLKTIRTHNRSDLLIKFDINGRQKESITNVIIGTLKKQKYTKPNDVFMLAVDWDDETFFRQLLLEKWKWLEHENVLMELLKRGDNKYVKLILEHNCNSKWLMKPQGPLEEEFKKIKCCKDLFSKMKDSESKANNRIMGKVLFLWCTCKQMPDTAMLFWKRGQDCLAMALVAYQESKKQKKDLVNKKGYEQIKDQIKIFSKLTLDFVRKSYEDDSKRTHDLIIGKVKDLDDRTPLQIAVDANFRAFVSEAAIQDLLNKIWVKDLENYDRYNYIPMFLSEACPLLAPKLFEIPDDSNSENQSSTTRPTDRCASVRKYFSKVKSFIDIPLVKFSYAFISFLAYLTLFSIVLLTEFRPKITPTEIALIIWTFILIIEKVRQAIVDIREYKGNKWNYFDIAALTIYITGFIMRTIYHSDPTICPDCLYYARIVLAFSLLIFFFRTLQFLSVYERLGPKIFMMYQLVADLVSFLVILAVFVSAYGVVSNVILYPNQPLNGKLLRDVFYDAWWSVLQQFNMDALGSGCIEDPSANITADYCSSTTDDNINYALCKEYQCPANSWIVPLLLSIYSLITCIMLLNVLIAIFNSTFEAINEEQTEVSRMQRYRLIREFSSRSMVPPPLCVVTYPYFIIQELRRRRKAFGHQALEDSTTDRGNKESSLNDDDYEDAKGDQNVKRSKPSTSPLNPFEKDLISAVKDWEHHFVEEYHKEIKDKKGWYVARLESKAEKTEKFDEIPFMQIHYPADS